MFFKFRANNFRRKMKIKILQPFYPISELSFIDFMKYCTNRIEKDLMHLRLLIGCIILVRSAMFGETFNLVTRVGLL